MNYRIIEQNKIDKNSLHALLYAIKTHPSYFFRSDHFPSAFLFRGLIGCVYKTMTFANFRHCTLYNIIMEEYRQQQCFSVDQREDTLLSHKMLKIGGYSTTKCFIESIQAKESRGRQTIQNINDFLLPILSFTANFDFDLAASDSTTVKTIKLRKSHPNRKQLNYSYDNNDSIATTTKFRREKSSSGSKAKDNEKGYRFLKIEKRQHRYDRLLFEESVLSLKDITGEGYILLRGGRILEGEFVQGMPISPLRIKFQNGIVYSGPVYNYRPHGVGEMTMANGERYTGEFCYGEPHGEGVHYSAEGKVKREGEWRHGKFVN